MEGGSGWKNPKWEAPPTTCFHVARVRYNLNLFDQRISLQAPVNDVIFFGPKEVSWVPPVNDVNVFGPL